MKIRRLPEIDLARIAPEPRERQHTLLRQIRDGYPPLTYGPVRGCFPDIFNVEPEMFGPVAPTAWAIIAAALRRKCASAVELNSNMCVARGLYDYAIENKISGRSQEFFPLSMGVGQKVTFWLPMILIADDRPFVPFIDPRRTRQLNTSARRFVFSMMHERIRAADPDFASVEFAVIQFGEEEHRKRRPIVNFDSSEELYSLDEMQSMIAATYSIWQEVCEERRAEASRKAAGRGGGLL